MGNSGGAAAGEEQAEQQPHPGGDADRHQRFLPHGLLDPWPQGGVEVVEELLQLLLQRAEGIGHLVRLLAGGVQQLLELLLHPMAGETGLAADHLHGIVEAATGGLQGVARHLGPFPLDGGQQGLKALAEGELELGEGRHLGLQGGGGAGAAAAIGLEGKALAGGGPHRTVGVAGGCGGIAEVIHGVRGEGETCGYRPHCGGGCAWGKRRRGEESRPALVG